MQLCVLPTSPVSQSHRGEEWALPGTDPKGSSQGSCLTYQGVSAKAEGLSPWDVGTEGRAERQTLSHPCT